MSVHTEQDSPTTRRRIYMSATERWVVHQELRQLKVGGGEAWVCARFDKPEKLHRRPPRSRDPIYLAAYALGMRRAPPKEI